MKRPIRQFIKEKRKWTEPLSESDVSKGFRGWHSRGYLPHFDAPGAVQFVSFRLADAMPATRRGEWEQLLQLEDEREKRTRLEAYLDQGHGACVLRDSRAAELVEEALLCFDNQQYRLLAWVIMPNHVHAVVEVWQMPLSQVVQGWKSVSARGVNRLLGRTGRLWEPDYFDRYMRNEEHFRKTVHYVETNPVKARLVREPQLWKFGSAARRSADATVRMSGPDEHADGGIRAPMRLGIFVKTFSRGSCAEILEVVAAHGLHCVQFNFACVGLLPMPDSIAPELLEQIRRDCAARAIEIAGVSGTFNMIHPDPRHRADGLRRLEVLAAATRQLGCHFISLCTGTRDPQDMWRNHLENDSPEAWRDMRSTLERAVAIAEQHDVILGIEPETGNVVNSARKARQILDEMKSPRLKIILDTANLFRSADAFVRAPMRARIAEAFDLLAPDIHLAHAKELAADGSMGNLAPGQGVLDWDFYFHCLRRIKFHGPVLMHGLAERNVSSAVRFLLPKVADET